MNEYQEALNYIKDYIDIKGDDNIAHFNQLNVEILQELINNYEHLNQIAGDTEKALDKACEELEYYTKEYKGGLSHMSKDKWKEWLLHE